MTRKTAKPMPSKLPKQVQTAIEEIAQLQPEVTMTLSPIQMLGIAMKVALKERITSEEIDQICTTYYYLTSEASRF